MMSLTYLITGGSRGIGYALVATYLAREDHTVIAAVRNIKSKESERLFNLPRGLSSKLIVVKIDSEVEEDPFTAASELQSRHGIYAVDVVIANAGISKVFPAVAEVKISDMLEHFRVNTIAPILLFQAFRPLLTRSSAKHSVFVTLSTSAATIADMETRNFPNAAYGTSKVALNYLTRKIHFEDASIIAFPIDPGWVQTDMGNTGARLLGLAAAEISVEDSVSGLVDVIDSADKEGTSGKFLDYTGRLCNW